MSDPWEGVEEEVADEASSMIRLVGEWAMGNVREMPDPPSSLDGALDAVDDLNEDLDAALQRKKEAARLAEKAIKIALGVLVGLA